MICLLIFLEAALMCYSNNVIGSRVILDVFRAKESSSSDCDCTVTSDTPTKFTFSTHNNLSPGSGCGSSLLFTVNGENVSRSCHVSDMQLPSSNHSETTVKIKINDPHSAINGSNVVLNMLTLSCNGDPNLPVVTQTTPSVTTMTSTTTASSSYPTSSSTVNQSTTTAQSMASTTTSTTITISLIIMLCLFTQLNPNETPMNPNELQRTPVIPY